MGELFPVFGVTLNGDIVLTRPCRFVSQYSLLFHDYVQICSHIHTDIFLFIYTRNSFQISLLNSTKPFPS